MGADLKISSISMALGKGLLNWTTCESSMGQTAPSCWDGTSMTSLMVGRVIFAVRTATLVWSGHAFNFSIFDRSMRFDFDLFMSFFNGLSRGAFGIGGISSSLWDAWQTFLSWGDWPNFSCLSASYWLPVIVLTMLCFWLTIELIIVDKITTSL